MKLLARIAVGALAVTDWPTASGSRGSFSNTRSARWISRGSTSSKSISVGEVYFPTFTCYTWTRIRRSAISDGLAPRNIFRGQLPWRNADYFQFFCQGIHQDPPCFAFPHWPAEKTLSLVALFWFRSFWRTNFALCKRKLFPCCEVILLPAE